MTSSSAMVVAASERSPSWIAVSSAERSAGSTAGANQDAAVEDEAASSLLLLRRRTTVDADVDVDVEERADTAATTLACSSADQLPTSAASSSLPRDAKTSATLVADEAIDETGVEAMSSKRRERYKGGREAKSDGAGKLRSVENMFILTCAHVLHHMSTVTWTLYFQLHLEVASFSSLLSSGILLSGLGNHSSTTLLFSHISFSVANVFFGSLPSAINVFANLSRAG